MVGTGSKTTPSLIEYWAIRTLSKVIKTFVINNPVDANELSRDPQTVKAYHEDPLVHTLASFETLTTVVLTGEELLSQGYSKINMPVLITHGDHDTQTSPIASKKFFDLLSIKDKTYVSLADCYHETHNEPEPDRSKVIKLWIEWILARAK